jgi:hypothetical protein
MLSTKTRDLLTNMMIYFRWWVIASRNLWLAMNFQSKRNNLLCCKNWANFLPLIQKHRGLSLNNLYVSHNEFLIQTNRYLKNQTSLQSHEWLRQNSWQARLRFPQSVSLMHRGTTNNSSHRLFWTIRFRKILQAKMGHSVTMNMGLIRRS